MNTAKQVGRVIGLTLVVQILVSAPVYARLLVPATNADYLTGAAGAAMQIRIGLLLMFVLGAQSVVAAVVALPLFRQHSERMAFAYLALSAVALATLAMESMATRNLLTVSLEVAKQGEVTETLRTLGAVGRTNRATAHFTNLVFAHATLCFLFLILFRFSLVPRALAGFGVAATLLSTTAVAMPLLGYRFSFTLLQPVAVASVALALWLLIRGLADRPSPAAMAHPELARA